MTTDGAIQYFLQRPIGKTKSGDPVFMDWEFYQFLIAVRDRTGGAAENFIADAFARLSGVTETYFQDNEPVGAAAGSYWFDTNDGDAPYRLDEDGTWVDASDDATAQAILAATEAQDTADGKVTTFVATSAPTAEGVGDLWYNPDTRAVKRWDGDSWDPIAGNAGVWRAGNPLVTGATTYRTPIDPTSSIDAGATATIEIAAHTLKTSDADGATKTVSYNSGSVTGLSFETQYFVFAHDPTFAGGAVTYVAALSSETYITNNEYVFVGSPTTVADGGGGGGGGFECVWEEAWLSTVAPLQARDVHEDWAIDCLTHDMAGVELVKVDGAHTAVQLGVRLVSRSGVVLTCSVTTPITQPDGDTVSAKDAKGAMVAVMDANGFRWEPILHVERVGEIRVRRIHVGGRTYAAGDDPARMMFTHNTFKP